MANKLIVNTTTPSHVDEVVKPVVGNRGCSHEEVAENPAPQAVDFIIVMWVLRGDRVQLGEHRKFAKNILIIIRIIWQRRRT